jgi:hypothetical protein
MKTTDLIQKSAKTAGITYLLIIGTSILSMIFGPYKLIIEGDTVTTMSNIGSNQFLFRVGATYDLLMYMSVIILSVALYNLLNMVNKTVALTALFCRIGEALIGSLTVICSISIIFLINIDMKSESAKATVQLLFEVKAIALNVVFAFLGLGSILYCYLFYKSRFVPRLLAAFGIFSFVLVFAESILVLLIPIKSMIFTGIPAILFEITIGFWLLVKGVNTDKMNPPSVK